MPRETALLGWKSFILLFCVALGLGGMYRFADLGKKPMHTDEAILALKTQEFWRTGFFKYDPKDYHGPMLHHATRAMGLGREMGPDDLNERRLRVVVAICGFALILVPLFFLDVLGKTGVAMASLLIAVSPMMNYYSRYYIMEMLMVLLGGLALGFLWCWAKWRKGWWLLLAGACVGGMHATKETFVFSVAAMFIAWAAVKVTGGSFEVKQSSRMMFSPKRGKVVISWRSWFGFLLAAALVSVWQFSNGFQEWTGVLDSGKTYLSYLQRSEGSGHEKPWWWYLEVLYWYKDGFIWTEALSAGLAVLGLLSLFFDLKEPKHIRAAQLFVAVHSIALLAMYSAIPYKTPWTVMGAHFSIILLAGLGARWLFLISRPWFLKAVLFAGLTVGIYHLCFQTSMATDYKFRGEVRYSADGRNPFVYSHTSTSFLNLVRTVKRLAKVDAQGKNMAVTVVQREYGWPMPWYLRDMPNVGYTSQFPERLDAPVVIVDLDQENQATELLKKSWQQVEGEQPPLYVTSVFGLRPGTNLAVLIRSDLWEAYNEAKKKEPVLPANEAE